MIWLERDKGLVATVDGGSTEWLPRATDRRTESSVRCAVSGNMVEVIHSSSDVLSIRLITTYSTEEFVRRAAEAAICAKRELESTRKSLSLLRRVGGVTLVAIGMFVVLMG